MDYSAGILFQTIIINMKQAQELTKNNQPEKLNISGAFFDSDLDSAIPKANCLAFHIASPTGQSFVLTRECLMEPQRHRFFSIFSG